MLPSFVQTFKFRIVYSLFKNLQKLFEIQRIFLKIKNSLLQNQWYLPSLSLQSENLTRKVTNLECFAATTQTPNVIGGALSGGEKFIKDQVSAHKGHSFTTLLVFFCPVDY